MDFFQYASYAAAFTDTFWIQFLIGGLCFALVFAFQAIALFIIASREGYKNKWMAFIPFLNTYYIGVCAQKNKFYNMDTKKSRLRRPCTRRCFSGCSCSTTSHAT